MPTWGGGGQQETTSRKWAMKRVCSALVPVNWPDLFGISGPLLAVRGA